MQERSSKKIEILDSTLRDGAQGEGISFSVQDKIHICQALDELGVAYIEAGNPGSNPKDMEFFQEMKKVQLKNARLCAFGSTRRKDIKCSEDTNLQSLLSAGTETVVIFGKSWAFQVTDILRTSLEENLLMIKETCAFLKEKGRRVIYDAEHFFTGYQDNSEYALKTLQAALDGGAEVLCLCETKGGCMPDDIREIVKDVVSRFDPESASKNSPEILKSQDSQVSSGAQEGQCCPSSSDSSSSSSSLSTAGASGDSSFTKTASRVKIGIHCHNDSGLAVANSIIAVQEGATHLQGTLLGFGERTGNANLSCIIPNLELKLGYSTVGKEKIKNLTAISKRVAEITNISLNPQLPYVGAGAFSHKAGMHIDAVLKNPDAYEHVSPESVGNARVFLMSEVAGRATIIEKLSKIDPSISKNSEEVKEVIGRMKQLEFEGYQFEGADGSFELLARKIIGRYQPFFKLHYYQTNGVNPRPEDGVCACAQIKLEVDGQVEVTAGEGDGPVNALDIALRKALSRFYPSVSQIRLIDYKVRVLDGSGTDSRVRVLIESTDGIREWTTVGVSSDIMEASWLALCDSFEYKLIKDIERHLRR